MFNALDIIWFIPDLMGHPRCTFREWHSRTACNWFPDVLYQRWWHQMAFSSLLSSNFMSKNMSKFNPRSDNHKACRKYNDSTVKRSFDHWTMKMWECGKPNHRSDDYWGISWAGRKIRLSWSLDHEQGGKGVPKGHRYCLSAHNSTTPKQMFSVWSVWDSVNNCVVVGPDRKQNMREQMTHTSSFIDQSNVAWLFVWNPDLFYNYKPFLTLEDYILHRIATSLLLW